MIKYEGSFIYKIINRIKSFFVKENDAFRQNEDKKILEQSKKELDNEKITGYKKYRPTDDIIRLVRIFETNQDIIKELTNQQIKALTEYYREKYKELNREYEYKKKKFDDLAKELNDYCKKAELAKKKTK